MNWHWRKKGNDTARKEMMYRKRHVDRIIIVCCGYRIVLTREQTVLEK